MLGKRFEILSYAICKISFECYASVWHAILRVCYTTWFNKQHLGEN